MGRLTQILEGAQGRAKELGLPYDGALLPAEAHELLSLAPGARLVDVRTRAELEWVGRVPGSVEIEWQTYPGGQPNPDFEAELTHQVDRESLVMFLCRSGGRSHAAAAAAKQFGYTEVYNVLQGFEGDKDPQSHRNTVGGWRFSGLPWIQS
ncbi:MAG: rhodanese-like domain-containing protein [Betaproteobacteria bacterium]|nr:rhodanese-like domain-containing protein [Betaproteobacteria bacterium]